ncbi:hypothetical protein EV356DRAFT_363035 [Viridothelium virens]|uniref:Copper acquisition factor BIM1-like domain-containing protein n=1 Tax=Viridothelium virens TaxID=1048519 RepID=A0A6A6HK69_VIRVR|nr:hypothetical protein EV356DRAFT_363035 [Viridothelium virens]
MMSLKATLLALLPLASAHFKLNYPAARGFDEDTLPTFPCGGQNNVSPNRTMWPVGGPIQLDMGHISTNVQVLLGMGNDPGSNFDTILVPTFHVNGLNNFCLGMVDLPSGLNMTDGMNATIQVVTNGDDGPGGLYNCADVTLTNTPLDSTAYSQNCMNSTHVTSQPLQGATETTMANSTGDGTAVSSSASGSASPSSSSSSSSSSSQPSSAAGLVRVAEWGLVTVAGAAGFALL